MSSDRASNIEIRRFETVDSTNRLAQQAVRAGGLTGPVVFVAERQDAGQGRHGRTWHSPAGGLWCTSAWPVRAASASVLDGLGLRVGVACHATIQETLQRAESTQHAAIKWPNDILIDAKKTCGCLCRVERARAETWLIIGVGINANNDPDTLASDLRRTPTSLARETGRTIDLDQLLAGLLAHLSRAAATLGLPSDWLAAARGALFGVGTIIEVTSPHGGITRGTLIGLDERGRVVLDTSAGRTAIEQAVEVAEPADSPRV